MKFISVTGDAKSYDFAGADAIAAYAARNNLMLRMHTLLWHNQTPDVIFEEAAASNPVAGAPASVTDATASVASAPASVANATASVAGATASVAGATASVAGALAASVAGVPANRAALLATLKSHTKKMGDRFGKQIYVVDVANEVIEDKGDALYRKTKWHDVLGDTMLDDAFAFAREFMPGVKLCYNDYNESDPGKSRKIFELVKSLKGRGVPVDTLGLQAHWNIDTRIDDVKRAFDLYSKLGVTLQVTELDVSMYPSRGDPGADRPSAEMIKKQVNLYKESFAIFREYKDIVDSVTTWGVADDATWLSHFPVARNNWPLLFDADHQPKEAYHAIMDF
jgi:endo-1,4-beta-xylanase